jgi:amidophosphoribosyltransferase
MAKDVGARKVIFASCAPPIRYSNVYGIDMPSRHELVAHDRTTEEISTEIGADLVIYQEMQDLIRSCRELNESITSFDCSVFNGEYVTGGVDAAYLDRLERLRNDNAKAKKMGQGLEEAVVEIEGGCMGPMSQCIHNIPGSQLTG